MNLEIFRSGAVQTPPVGRLVYLSDESPGNLKICLDCGCDENVIVKIDSYLAYKSEPEGLNIGLLSTIRKQHSFLHSIFFTRSSDWRSYILSNYSDDPNIIHLIILTNDNIIEVIALIDEISVVMNSCST